MLYELRGTLKNLNQLKFLCEEEILSNNFYELNKNQFVFVSCQLKRESLNEEYIALKIDITLDKITNNFYFKINPIILIENVDYTKKIINLHEDDLYGLNNIDIRELYKDFFHFLSYEICIFHFDKSIIPFLKYYINNETSVSYIFVEEEKQTLCMEIFDDLIIKTNCDIDNYDNIYFTHSKITNNNTSDNNTIFLKLPDFYLNNILDVLNEDKKQYITNFLNSLSDQEAISIINGILDSIKF